MWCLIRTSFSSLVTAALLTVTPPLAMGDTPLAVADDREITDYDAAIEALERDYGPYHNDLSQHLASLGEQMRREGRLEEARDSLERAMHLNRINEGIYSLNQAPILERLIETNIAAGDWERAGDNHQYLFWLHRRNYRADDPRMLPTLTRLSRWHLNAAVMGFGSGIFQHLVNAHHLFSSAAGLIEHAFGPADLRLVDALRGLTASNYYLASYQNLAQKNDGFTAHFGGASSDENLNIEQYILRSFSNGRDAISRIQEVYELNPDAPPDAALRAQVELGDWHMLFGRSFSATELYEDVITRLGTTTNGDKIITELFGAPVELPIIDYLKFGEGEHPTKDQYVVVTFDVTHTGRARNVNIVESYPENKVSIRSRVRNTLKVARFRPRFENGVAVSTEKIERRYLFNED